MKKITTITLGLALSLSSFATVFTVNNSTTTPGNPGQYATIETAFAAASPGDTLLVKGSLTPYTLAPSTSFGTLLINKRICIIGEGYKPNGGANPPTTVNGTFTFSTNSASGSSIWGLIGSSLTFNSSQNIRLNNITIRRNAFNYINLNDSSYNFTIAENFIAANIYLNSGLNNNLAKHVNLKILNNIFSNSTVFPGGGNLYSFQVKNNLFINGTFNSPLSSLPSQLFNPGGSAAPRCQNAIFENNIFYNTLPSPNNSSISLYGPISCSFINNITFSAVTNPLLSTLIGNSFSGNLDNTDPGYANLFTNTASNRILTSSDIFNIRISNSSPAKNAGTDGTDIGPTGGAYPIYNNVLANEQLSGEPPLPQVRSANFTNNVNAVQTGGTLQINVIGRKRN